MMNEPFVFGVDGGTTKTIALVADGRGRILGAGRGGNSNWVGPDVEKPMAVVVAAVRQALDAAGLSGGEIAMGVLGLAGADWPEDYERRERFLAASGIAQRVIVKNDAIVAWRANTDQRFGAVIVAGTGTNTCVIAPDGTEWCYGYYADDGGAADVARRAIQAVLRAEDGRGAPTALTEVVLGHLACATPEEMLRASYAGELEAEDVLAICPLVFETADAGDDVAAMIIRQQGLALAEYANAAIRRFGMEVLAFDVVLAGSVFKGQGPLLVDTVSRSIRQVAPRARIVRMELEPAVGGVMLAYDALRLAVSDEMRENLRQTLPAPDFFSTADGKGVGGRRFRRGSRP